MKVLLINGSPRPNGCTNRALREVVKSLEAYNVDTEIFHIGAAPIQGCIGCRRCKSTGTCVFQDELYLTLRHKLENADGVIIGSPVYYSGPNGSLCALLDRIFFSSGSLLKGKPAAAVVSCRARGAVAAFQRLNAYFTATQAIVVPSQYWNVVHGTVAEDVDNDTEGLQLMRVLGKNMAWLLKVLEQSHIDFYDSEELHYKS